MSKLRYGVIGTGHMGRYHVNVVKNLKNCEFAGIYDTDKAQAEKIAAQFKVDVFDSLEELLQECDAVSCAVPTSLHYEIGKKVLESGTHLLVEKPIADNVEQAHDLIETARLNKLVFHVGHVERFNGAVSELENVVTNVRLWESRRLGPDTGRIHDAGVIMDLMIHDIDICLRFVKSPVKDMTAYGTVIDPSRKHEDAASALLTFENGCVASFSASRLTQAKFRTLSISQPESYIVLDFTTQDLSIHKQGSSLTTASNDEIKYKQESLIERVFVHKENPLHYEISFFLNEISEGNTTYESNQLDLETLKVATELTSQVHRQFSL